MAPCASDAGVLWALWALWACSAAMKLVGLRCDLYQPRDLVIVYGFAPGWGGTIDNDPS